MKLKQSYTTRASAQRAMWRYVSHLQREGIHTGALRGDDGNTAQWIDNARGLTSWARVEVNNDNYYQPTYRVVTSRIQL